MLFVVCQPSRQFIAEVKKIAEISPYLPACYLAKWKCMHLIAQCIVAVLLLWVFPLTLRQSAHLLFLSLHNWGKTGP